MTSLFSWLGIGSFTRISYFVGKYFWTPTFYLMLGKFCFLGVGGFISNLSGKILTAVILKALFLPFQELFLIAYYNEANNCFNYCIRKYHLVYSFATATAPYIFFSFFKRIRLSIIGTKLYVVTLLPTFYRCSFGKLHFGNIIFFWKSQNLLEKLIGP